MCVLVVKMCELCGVSVFELVVRVCVCVVKVCELCQSKEGCGLLAILTAGEHVVKCVCLL